MGTYSIGAHWDITVAALRVSAIGPGDKQKGRVVIPPPPTPPPSAKRSAGDPSSPLAAVNSSPPDSAHERAKAQATKLDPGQAGSRLASRQA